MCQYFSAHILIAQSAKTAKFALNKNLTKANFVYVRKQWLPEASTSGARLKQMLQARDKFLYK